MNRRWRLEPAAFALLLVAHLLPFWQFRFVATQDGPGHLEDVVAWLSLEENPALGAAYTTNVLLAPNRVGHALLAVLASVFPAEVAEKLQQVLYTIALPLAFRHALPVRARRRGYALAIFPFLHGYAFFMGFSSFSWSLVPFFWTLGLASRNRWLRSRRALVPLGIGVLATAVAHVVTLVALLAALAGLALGGGGAALVRLRRAVSLAAAALPAAGLVALFWIRGVEGHALAWLPLAVRATGTMTLLSLGLFDRSDAIVAAALAAATAAGCVLVLARGALRTGARPWLAAAGATAVLAITAPNELGAGWAITPRVQFLPFVLAAVAVGTARRPARVITFGPVVPALAATAFLILRWPQLDALDRSLREYVSLAPAIERGATLLPMQLTLGRSLEGDRYVPQGFLPFLHASGYIVAERGAVGLANYEAATSLFPIRYRPERDPYRILARGPGIEGESALPCADLLAGEPALRVDYVLVWGPPAQPDPPDCVVRWLDQLGAAYDRVAVSSPMGRAQLWRRRRTGPRGFTRGCASSFRPERPA